jgi:glutamate dehydrogenase
MIEAVQDRIQRNARNILNEDEIARLEEPAEVHEYVAESSLGSVTVARTQHRTGLDGSGGGLKRVEIAPGSLSVPEMIARNRQHSLGLGTLMTLKGNLIVLNLPGGYGNDFGGAKGEMYIPAGLSDEEKDEILRGYVATQYMKGALGVGIDRHAPDMNTGPHDMDVMAQTLVNLTGDEKARAAFSGKSIEVGGLEGRDIATGQGMVYTLGRHLEAIGRNPEGMTVVVQGAGNVGKHFAQLAQEQLGVRIVGISDKDKAIVAGTGDALDFSEVQFADKGIGSWNEDRYKELDTPDDLLEADVDILVFAAAPDVVTEKRGNKERIRASIILQGANNPMDSQAIDYYVASGKIVIADILANAGGFVASNYEYNQAMTGDKWTEAMVLSALKRVMDEAHDRVYAEAVEMGNARNMVDAAFTTAIKRQYERDHQSGLLVPAR